jgi:hypothetical protein
MTTTAAAADGAGATAAAEAEVEAVTLGEADASGRQHSPAGEPGAAEERTIDATSSQLNHLPVLLLFFFKHISVPSE